MNVYEIDVWRQVKNNGEFSHTVTRLELIHALNEERAKKKITLAEPKTYQRDNITTEVTGEFIYRITRTGTVTIQPYYKYSDGRSPRPVRRG